MGIQTSLIQTLLYSKMMVTVMLLQPYFFSFRFAIVKLYYKSKGFKAFYHILYALYCMVFLIFLDSLYRYSKSSSQVLSYQAERNFYLSGFTLFLAVVLNKLCDTLYNTFLTEQKNQQNIKQHGNSMKFVTKVIEDAKSEKEKNEELKKEIENLKEEISRNKAAVAEIDNNKKVYLALKDKYEKLKESQGESRKNK